MNNGEQEQKHGGWTRDISTWSAFSVFIYLFILNVNNKK